MGYHYHYYRSPYYRRIAYVRYPSHYSYYQRRTTSRIVERNRRDGRYSSTYEGRVFRRPATPVRRPSRREIRRENSASRQQVRPSTRQQNRESTRQRAAFNKTAEQRVDKTRASSLQQDSRTEVDKTTTQPSTRQQNRESTRQRVRPSQDSRINSRQDNERSRQQKQAPRSGEIR
jgi:hypothetical protein